MGRIDKNNSDNKKKILLIWNLRGKNISYCEFLGKKNLLIGEIKLLKRKIVVIG